LGDAIEKCAQPPPVWLNASTATIYKQSFDRDMDETGEIASDRDAKDEFSVEVAQAWEEALNQARTPATRKIALRLSMVFGPREGTVFRVLRRLARLGLGGSMGGGRQFVSWIHEEDFCRAAQWLLTHDNLTGPFNTAWCGGRAIRSAGRAMDARSRRLFSSDGDGVNDQEPPRGPRKINQLRFSI
jgi:NAD dependent epimerase/dehydratase family enzyme